MASRNWIFTLNNWTQEDLSAIEAWVDDDDDVAPVATYACVGEEVAETGTPHLQGFVQWITRRRLGFCKTKAPTAHWEVSVAPDAAVTYCKKDGAYHEFGERAINGRGNNGQREILYNAYKKGGPAAAEDACPIGWAFTGHALTKNVVREAPFRPTIKAEWLWGPSGSGKTRRAWAPWAEHGSSTTAPYAKISTVKWWNGYRGQETVIIDDLTKGGLGIHHLLTWCDRYPTQVETKGGMEPLYATHFIVTSNYTPEEVYPDAGDESVVALRRRFTFEHITHA
ncbi:MAG: helicase [Cressdnaviricota sp.]|nr:MAG: helicase [Cressdnaviricota sp.]